MLVYHTNSSLAHRRLPACSFASACQLRLLMNFLHPPNNNFCITLLSSRCLFSSSHCVHLLRFCFAWLLLSALPPPHNSALYNLLLLLLTFCCLCSVVSPSFTLALFAVLSSFSSKELSMRRSFFGYIHKCTYTNPYTHLCLNVCISFILGESNSQL